MVERSVNPAPEQTALIHHCIRHLESEYQYRYSQQSPDYGSLIAPIAEQTLGAIARCDAPYHNLEHTIQVVLVGKEILQGKFLCGEAIAPEDWFNFIVALLCHDIGYLKDICPTDAPTEHRFATGVEGVEITLPDTATGASLTPYHVDRGQQFVTEILAPAYPLLDVAMIQGAIERTRFPVPKDAISQQTHDLPGLARAADLIGQLADPTYLLKLPSLFQEFAETGANGVMGYTSPEQLRAGYPRFYWQGVSLYLKHGIRYLEVSQSGQAILANLYGNRAKVEQELDRLYGRTVWQRLWQRIRVKPR
ncbi:MAG: metal-dependent phosphohydrolase [Spirulinaceae cyanobacterium]